MMSICVWCLGVTGQSFACTCKRNCMAGRCPVEAEPYDSGWSNVPVPEFQKEEEDK